MHTTIADYYYIDTTSSAFTHALSFENYTTYSFACYHTLISFKLTFPSICKLICLFWYIHNRLLCILSFRSLEVPQIKIHLPTPIFSSLSSSNNTHSPLFYCRYIKSYFYIDVWIYPNPLRIIASFPTILSA